MKRRSVVLALCLAGLWLAASVPAAFAECMNWPMGQSDRPNVSFAFTAEVAAIVESPDPTYPEKESYRQWTATLTVERVYRGEMPRTIELQSTNWGCSQIYPGYLSEGDRVFIASEKFDRGDYETELGDVFAWQRIGSRWRFYEAALRDSSYLKHYPATVRLATTTTDILRSLSVGPMPDTATLPPVGRRGSGMDLTGAAALVFLASFVIALGRTRRDETRISSDT